MTLADMKTITDWLKGHVKPAEGQLLRGHIHMDAVGMHGTGAPFAYSDGQHVATIMGIRIYREDALADAHMDYYAEDSATLIHTV